MDPVDAVEAARLHRLLMEVVRAGAVLHPDHPVSLSQVTALHELDVEPPLSQRDLAERLHLDKSSVSRLAAELERRGLLERERDPDNHRQYRLRLTARGRSAHRDLAHTFHQRYERWVAGMTRQERAALLEGLPALVRAIRQDGVGVSGTSPDGTSPNDATRPDGTRPNDASPNDASPNDASPAGTTPNEIRAGGVSPPAPGTGRGR